MKDKEKERIRQKLEKFGKREIRRQGRYVNKVAKMSQSERDAELEKVERKIAKLESKTYKRLIAIRLAGAFMFGLFGLFYGFLYWIGVSHHTFGGAMTLLVSTFVFIWMLSGYMSVYGEARREYKRGKDD